jgi:hypothetical protein
MLKAKSENRWILIAIENNKTFTENKNKKDKKIDDTFDIQHIFMKDFLQHLNVEEEKKIR